MLLNKKTKDIKKIHVPYDLFTIKNSLEYSSKINLIYWKLRCFQLKAIFELFYSGLSKIRAPDPSCPKTSSGFLNGHCSSDKQPQPIHQSISSLNRVNF